MQFHWDDANVAHIAEHEVLPEEAEDVLYNAPLFLGERRTGGEDRMVFVGVTNGGTWWFQWCEGLI